ncbi:hypothetical protein [Methanomethylophilus alvi]|uniref:hypothetical protein n=1 Tax=Methanomethylophilus alvi TaxID=1291540 RepID=UPI0037DC62B1
MISAHKVLLASVAALMLMASAPYILLADTGGGSTSEDPVEVEPYFSLRYDGGALPLYKENITMNGIPMTRWSSGIKGFSEEKVSIEWFKHGTSEKVDPYNDTTLESNYLAGPALAGGYDVLIKYDGQEVYNKYVVIEKTNYVKISQESEFTEYIEPNNGYDTANYAIVAEMNGKLYAMGYEKSGENHEAEAIEVFANEDGSITLGDTHVLTFIPSKNEFNNSLWDFGTGKRGKGTMLVSGNDIGSFYPPNGTYKEYGITVKFSDGESESFSVGGKMMPSGSVITYNAGKDSNSPYLRLVENKDGTVCFTGTSIESDIRDWSPVYFYKEYVEIVEPEFTCIFAGDLNKIYDGTPVTINTYKDIIISGSYFSWEEVCGYDSKIGELIEESALALPYWMKVEDKEGTLWDYSGYFVDMKPTGVISGPKDVGSYILVIKTRNTTSDEFEDTVFAKFDITSDHEHTFGDWEKVDDDYHSRSCECGYFEKAEHSWNDGVVTTEPTCTERGEKTYTCSTCDATKTEIVGATGHSFGDWTEKDGNEHTRICSKCQTSETEAHSWNNGEITLEPTCTENGTNTYTCTYCGATKTEIVNANGHHLTEWIYFDKDTHRNNCDVCDHFEEGTHTWTTNGPSEDGLTTYICGGCDATKVEATVTAETDGGSATVSGDTISDILSQMEGSADEKRVSIDTAGMGKVVLDQNSVSGLTSADAIVDLTFGEGTLTISKDVLNTVSDGTSPISISMNGVQKEELTDAQKEAVGDGLVFRFEASAGDEKIHELGGTVTVSVKYEPKEGEDVSALKAYYVDDEGELHLVGGYYDGSGHFVFDTDHFSYYVVKSAQENGGGDDGGDMTVYVAVAAVAIILLAVLGFVYMRRH